MVSVLIQDLGIHDDCELATTLMARPRSIPKAWFLPSVLQTLAQGLLHEGSTDCHTAISRIAHNLDP
jgi:hypothetical protein